jgi:outer membrane cobalamin receptor
MTSRAPGRCVASAAVVLATVLPVSGFAQSAGIPIQEVLVTADRIEQPLVEVPASTRIIDRARLDSLPARNTGEAVATLPNVLVRHSGSLFDEGSLSLYGIAGQPRAPSRTVIAVNGVPLNSGLVPETSLNLLPLGLVERMELIQGPGSAAYGSNATTGVLNVAVRQPDGWLAEADVLAGSRWDTWGADLRAGYGRPGEYSWIAAVSRRSTDGHLQPDGREDFSDSTLDNLALFGSRQLGALTVDAAWLRYDFDRHDPSTLPVGTPPGPTARLESGYRSHGTLGARWLIADGLTSEFRYIRNASSIQSAQTFRQPPVGPAAPRPADEDVVTDGWLAQLVWLAGPHRLSGGVEYQSVDQDDHIAGTDRSGNVRGAFLQYRHLSFEGRLALLAGYRYDDASTYADSSGSPKLGFVWRTLDDRWRLRVNGSKAFNAPTFTELFSTGGVVGNPDLTAQTLKLLESGLTWQPAPVFTADLSVFKSELRDPIFPRPNPALGPGIRQFQNVGPGVDTDGVVLALDWRPLQGLSVSGSYMYLDPGQATFHTAGNTLKAQVLYERARWFIGLASRRETDRYWRDDFQDPADDYTVVDARTGWSLSEQVRAELAWYNLTDEDYATTASIGPTSAVDLPRPGSHLMLQLSVRL